MQAVMLPAVAWSELASCEGVHGSAVHAVRPLNVPSAKHVAVRAEPLEYPSSHVTVTNASVTAAMLPDVAWSELANCDAVHASALQAVRPLNVPSDRHVAVRVAPLE